MVQSEILLMCLFLASSCIPNGLCDLEHLNQFRRLDNQLFHIEERLDNEAKARRDGLKSILDKLYIIEETMAGHAVQKDLVEQVTVNTPSDSVTDVAVVHSLLRAFQTGKMLNRRFQRHVDNLEQDVEKLDESVMDLKHGRKEEHEMLVGMGKALEHIEHKIDNNTRHSLEMLNTITNLDKKVNDIIGDMNKQHEQFESCDQLLNNGFTISGLYDIYPANRTVPLRVYCDQVTDGGGWTVFQRREDGSENFYRNWIEYKFGFGNLEGEFWLGNEYIHLLTRSCCHELRIDMADFENNHRYAKYSQFSIGSKDTNYMLTSGGYAGDSGDSFSAHNGYAFSTKDKDNDIHTTSCSVAYKGAWWYSKCHSSNLNGHYYLGKHDSYADGVNWHAWKEYHYSMKFTEMKCR